MAKYDLETDPENIEYMDEDYGKESYFLRMIANELAEKNRLKQIELELRIIHMQGVDPEQQSSLGKEDAQVFMKRLKDGSES